MYCFPPLFAVLFLNPLANSVILGDIEAILPIVPSVVDSSYLVQVELRNSLNVWNKVQEPCKYFSSIQPPNFKLQ
jgi:hypothetical protein